MILNKIKLKKYNTQNLKTLSEIVDFKVRRKEILKRLKETMQSWVANFTKTWTKVILLFSCFWITYCIGLVPFSDKLGIDYNVMVSLIDFSKVVVQVIPAVFIGYMLKAIFETKWEKQDEMAIRQIEQDDENLRGED